jgi:putative SOS response-associated peptidase YedK
MCFSARVEQDLHKLSREFGAEVAWDSFKDIFQRRAEGQDFKVARDLERNFTNPVSDVQRQSRDYIDEYLAQRSSAWEREVFIQRTRLAAAEESLSKKETKRAREDLRISTKKIQTTLGRLKDLRRSEPQDDDGRIFPMMYAPILIHERDRIVIRPMRYTCRLAGKPANYDQRFPGTYNARRDNLSGFWKSLYGRNHGVMVISGFFENVPKHLYEQRELVPGESPSNLVLQFNPRPAVQMLVACLWDRWTEPNGDSLDSFAAVTDEPPAEIAATGHQRCVISLRSENLSEWLSPKNLTRDQLEGILSDKECPYYEHQIAA